MVIVPFVFARREKAAANNPESSIWVLTATSLMCMCATFFHDQTAPSFEPNAIILVGFRGFSGFLTYATPTLVCISLNSISSGFVIRKPLYFLELAIKNFKVFRCSLA